MRLALRNSSILILYMLLIAVRVPQIIWPGRFWAEEGSIYFREAYTSNLWDVLTNSNLGYYSLFTKISSIIAAHVVPLEFSPIITMSFSLIAQVLPVWLLLYSKIPSLSSRFYKLVAVGIILFMQPNQEVWLNTINSQFFLFISTAIILISEPNNKLTHIIRLGILGLAGLTGVVSCLLLPFFVFEYIWTRKKYKLYETIMLTTVTTIQLVIVINGAGRDMYLDFKVLPFVLLVKQWILPMLGSKVADIFSNYVKEYHLYFNYFYVFTVLFPYIIFTIGLIIWGNRHSWILFGASITIASISFFTSVEAQIADRILGHLSSLGGGRYYYGPNVLMGLALLIPFSKNSDKYIQLRRYFRISCIILICLILTNGIYDFINSKYRHPWFFTGPSWPVEVEKWRKSKKDELKIWPRPWIMVLEK